MFQATFSTLTTPFSSLRGPISLPSDDQVLLGAQPQPDPFLLNFATTAYNIQSQTLRIPERFAWFSAGPPRTQAFEARAFLICIFAPLCTATGLLLFLLLNWIAQSPHLTRILVISLGIDVALAVTLCCYTVRNYGKMGRAGYVRCDGPVSEKCQEDMGGRLPRWYLHVCVDILVSSALNTALIAVYWGRRWMNA